MGLEILEPGGYITSALGHLAVVGTQRTSVVTGRQRRLTVQTRAVFAHGADGTHPVLVDDLIVGRELYVFGDRGPPAVTAGRAR